MCTTIGIGQLQIDCQTLRGQTETLCRSEVAAAAALASDPTANDPSTRKALNQFIDDKRAQQASWLNFYQETEARANDEKDLALAGRSALSAVGGSNIRDGVSQLQEHIEELPDEVKKQLDPRLPDSPLMQADINHLGGKTTSTEGAPMSASGAESLGGSGQAAASLGSAGLSVARANAAVGMLSGGVTTNGKLSPQNQQALQALNSGQPAEAEKTLTQTLARNPNDAAALSLRAQTRSETGDREGAVADARRALALNPNDQAAAAIVSQYEGQRQAQGRVGSGLKGLNFGAAAAAGAAGGGANAGGLAGGGAAPGAERTAAAGGFGAAGGASVAAEGASPTLRPLLENAATELRLGDYSSALLTLMRAQDRDPQNSAILDLIARASNEAKNPLGAINAADRALKLNPADAAALREKAYAEFSLGQNDQALADAERAVQLEPRNGLGYLYRAMIEEKLGRAADARRDYEAAQSYDPTLTPLAAEGLKRLGAAGGARGLPVSGRVLFRSGMIGVSGLLILLGLLGTATGRGLTTKARGLLSLRPATAEPRETAATILPGAFLGGHYRVVRELGRGGMGVVYQAFDETLRRPVAIKQLQREGRGDPRELERFLHEARMVAQLKHPHIAEIYSVVGGGDLLLVFEYVEGLPLDAVLAGGRLPAAEVRRLTTEIAAALDYAHGLKIVHRDLKPGNVMLAKTGASKVMDFGIAHQSRSGAPATQTNYVSGTPHYMSPEQMTGSVSPAADVYALGVMTYEMLTGRRPFEGPDFMEQKLGRRFAAASSVEPSLPPAVDALLALALEPDPTKRLPSARAFAAGLAEAFGATSSKV